MGKYNEFVEIGGISQTGVGFANGVVKAAEKDDKVVIILEDVGFPNIGWFQKNAPDRIIDCGIAEGNAAVVAAGLAAEGFTPFIYGFLFATLGRAYNQIRQSILVDRFNVKLMCREGAWGALGISHNYVEGLAMTRVMPNMVILNPADAVELEKAIIAMTKYIGPVLLRLESGFGSPPPIKIFKEDYSFEIGKAYTIKDGKDATIIATGYMVTEAVKSVELLEKDGIDIGIINMSTIKPLDETAIIKAAENTGAIITAENHSIIGGLGEAVASVLAENIPVPMVRFGVRDEFSQSGKMGPGVDELMGHFNLGAKDLALVVKDCIARKK